MTETQKQLPWPKPGEHQYRIVRDGYCGLEVQVRSFWFPIWHMPSVNTWFTLEEAEKYAIKIEERRLRKKINGTGYGVVKNIGVIFPTNDGD